MTYIHQIWADVLCRIFDDEKMIKSFMDSKYDLVLTDPAIPHGVILAKYLKLPLVFNVRWIMSGWSPITIVLHPCPRFGLNRQNEFHSEG